MSRRCSPLLAAAAALWVADLELETPGGVKVEIYLGRNLEGSPGDHGPLDPDVCVTDGHAQDPRESLHTNRKPHGCGVSGVTRKTAEKAHTGFERGET